MNIAALHPFTMSDYPGKLAAIAFCRGCDFRCPYCHNQELLSQHAATPTQPIQIWEFLQSRKGKLDAIVISGGEPTLQGQKLLQFTSRIKDMGFQIKLDTNGAHPALLSQLLKQNLIDTIAMDIKGPPDKYPQITGTNQDWHVILKSVSIIMNSSIDYEFRTTVANPLLTPQDIQACAQTIQGAAQYILQPYQPVHPPTPQSAPLTPPTHEELETMRQQAAPWVKTCLIRK